MTEKKTASINQLVSSLETELLPELHLESLNPHDPVVVFHLPNPWQVLGTGNYAAVVYHKDYPDFVVKIYAPGRPGFEEEVEVYSRLGSHPAFSECLYAEDGVLVLKRLQGVTLYDCIHQGLPIPKRVIQDIDEALEYALSCGLNPHDVHGRNVMMSQGRGLVVDVSDFLHTDSCTMWNHLKWSYYWFYFPLLYPFRLRIPYSLLDWVRRSYRFSRNTGRKFSKLALVAAYNSSKRV